MELLIDDNIKTTLEEVLNENEDLSETDIACLKGLGVGDIMYIGVCEIKRTK